MHVGARVANEHRGKPGARHRRQSQNEAQHETRDVEQPTWRPAQVQGMPTSSTRRRTRRVRRHSRLRAHC